MLLGTLWLPIDSSRRAAWLGMGWRGAVSGGRWAVWLEGLRQATERDFVDDPALWLGRGVCARKGSLWQECIDCLERAIELAGEIGLFGLQAEAMLERAIYLRLRGYLGRAADELAFVQRSAEQYRMMSVFERAKIEQAQLALDREDPDAALNALEAVEPNLHVLLLRAEALGLKGEVAAARDYINKIETSSQLDAAVRARLHTLKARIHRHMGEHELFRKECEYAIVLLEQTDDQYDLARAYNNLGTALLEAGGSRHEAITLYRRAQELQRVMGDAVALFASRHNITIANLSK
jgi:tetratricopeptide (TPR) repeat protein